jgi:thiosulfate/3-mercaptopyruvate sulfurtransferase
LGDALKHDTLISVAELQALLPNCVVIDVRHQLTDLDWGRDAFQQGHIPGAQFMHMDTDLSGPKGPGTGRHPLPDAALLTHKLAQRGVQRGQQVVVYDQSIGAMASRLWWMLKHWLGHDRTAVLDGGWEAWIKAGGQSSQQHTIAVATDYETRPQPTAYLNVDSVMANLQHASFTMVDARAAERFEGKTEPIDPVAGHIPRALNRPHTLNMTDRGVFKAPEHLAKEWQHLMAGRTADQIVHQCGSGVTACHNLLSMEVAGMPRSRVYPGSWSQWCSDPDRPVATGA